MIEHKSSATWVNQSCHLTTWKQKGACKSVKIFWKLTATRKKISQDLKFLNIFKTLYKYSLHFRMCLKVFLCSVGSSVRAVWYCYHYNVNLALKVLLVVQLYVIFYFYIDRMSKWHGLHLQAVKDGKWH